MIPLTKHADDWMEKIQHSIWDPNDGPLENLFRIGENYLIIFGGGPFAFLLLALKAMRMSPSSIGRMIDQGQSLTSVEDFLNMDHKKAAEEIAQRLESDSGGKSGFRPGSVVSDDWAKGDFVAPIQKTAVGMSTLFGKYGMTAAFMAAFGWLAKALMGDGIIAKILRGGTVAWMDSKNEVSEDAAPAHKTTNKATKQTPRQQLEERVERILGG